MSLRTWIDSINSAHNSKDGDQDNGHSYDMSNQYAGGFQQVNLQPVRVDTNNEMELKSALLVFGGLGILFFGVVAMVMACISKVKLLTHRFFQNRKNSWTLD